MKKGEVEALVIVCISLTRSDTGTAILKASVMFLKTSDFLENHRNALEN